LARHRNGNIQHKSGIRESGRVVTVTPVTGVTEKSVTKVTITSVTGGRVASGLENIHCCFLK
jgi:hypothetical protein